MLINSLMVERLVASEVALSSAELVSVLKSPYSLFMIYDSMVISSDTERTWPILRLRFQC
jgi:hypothetical protein